MCIATTQITQCGQLCVNILCLVVWNHVTDKYLLMALIFPLYLEQAPKWKVTRLHVDLPFSQADLLSELEQEDWVNPSVINNLGNDNWGGVRFKCMQPKPEHHNMLQLHDFFQSDELKRRLVNWMYETDPSMTWDWEWTPDQMCTHTKLHGEFSKDMPGFVNVMHTDYRKLVATGMVYFSCTDDDRLSTVFYDTQDRDNAVRMTTNFGDGWWHSNGNNTWHEGWNKTDQVRYSALLGLTLNIAPI